MCRQEDNPVLFKHLTFKCKHFRQIKYENTMNGLTAQPVNHEKKLCSYCFIVLFLQLESCFKKAMIFTN